MEKRSEILIVDDDSVLRETLSLLLAKSFNVLSASCASQACQILEENLPDLALVDLMMPGVDGITLLELIKQKYPNLPVIMLTASGSVASVVRAMKLGASDYLVKPFEPEELLFRIAEVKTVKQEQQSFKDQSNNFEKQKIIEALRKADFVQTRAAKDLGITRRMLKYKMDKLGI